MSIIYQKRLLEIPGQAGDDGRAGAGDDGVITKNFL